MLFAVTGAGVIRAKDHQIGHKEYEVTLYATKAKSDKSKTNLEEPIQGPGYGE